MYVWRAAGATSVILGCGSIQDLDASYIGTSGKSFLSATRKAKIVAFFRFIDCYQARVSFQRIIQKGSDSLPYTPQQIGLKPLVDAACCSGTTLGSYTQPPPMSILGAFAAVV